MTMSAPLRLLLYLVILTAFVSEFRDVVERLGVAGKLIKLLPDALSGVVLICVALELARRKLLYVPPRYLAVGLLLVLHLAIGAIVSDVSPDTAVAGIRSYLKYLPLFLLPLVVPPSDREIRLCLMFILGLLLIQVPISVLQRLISTDLSGDVVRGTMSSGAVMSIVLISAIGVLFAFHLRGSLSRAVLLTLVGLLFIPTMINETKGTVILLPFGILPVAMMHADPGKRLRRVAGLLGVCVLLLGAFTVVYNQMYSDRGQGIVEFFLEGGASTNVYKQKDIGEGKGVGRIDSIMFAYEEFRGDPMKLIFGLGIGNVSDSLIPGEYVEEYADHGVNTTTYSALIWEVGILGIVLSLVLLSFIARDSATLRVEHGPAGSLGLGWIAVCLVVFVSMLYKDLLHQNVVGYVFFYLAGVVVSRRVLMEQADTSLSRHDMPAVIGPPSEARNWTVR
ncbi:MAG: hypothetical protein RIC56_01430 [Pseudomonadales bacterium]